MDLVDIDQVLDNLELREAADEHNRTTLQAQNAAAEQSSSNQADKAGLNAAGYKSNFVGVSQVFNSLDDYQKNVESLESAPTQRYDEECRLISAASSNDPQRRGNSNTITKNLEIPEATNFRNSTNVESLLQATNNDNQRKVVMNSFDDSSAVRPMMSPPRHRDGDVDAEYEDEEEEGSDDLNKYTESSRHHRRIAYEMNETTDNSLLSTSDSLTTSSSSTFSSGPSPGILSTTDEHSAPLTPEDDGCDGSEDRDALLPKHSKFDRKSIDDEDDDDEDEVSVEKSDLTGAKETRRVEDGITAPQVDSTGGIEDIACGLSSISLTTTANSQFNLPTASSVLQNVLEDLSETVETNSLLSRGIERGQLKDAQAEKSHKNAESNVNEVESCKPEKGDANKVADIKVPLPSKPQPIKVFQQPITFGSTMDEISDTELDSMLQEMEIDDGGSEVDAAPRLTVTTTLPAAPSAYTGLATPKSTDPIKSAEPIAVPNSLVVNEDKINVANVSKASLDSEVDDIHEMAAVTSASNDSLNADSFSQASTVEFSEIRAPHPIEGTQHHIVDNVEMLPSSNSVASSYTGSDCSLEGNVIGVGVVADEPSIARDVGHKEALENADVIDEEEGSTDEGPYSSEAAVQRPQRPTSLNLPTLQQNLYENAGQTPPGTQPTQNKVLNMDGAAETTPVDDSNKVAANGTRTENANLKPNATANGELAEASGYSDPYAKLGKVPPIWVPDNMAAGCMQCHAKFTMIKRRHHCRACGKVLCSVCCSQKFKLEFLSNAGESRVCSQCFLILTQREQEEEQQQQQQRTESGGAPGNQIASGVDAVGGAANATTTSTAGAVRSPNPNNPMEYCSTIPPYRQVNSQNLQPPSVIVPVGVLKKESSSYSSNGSSSNGGGEGDGAGGKKGRKRKSVMFSDGIAPGSELADIEHQWTDAKHARRGVHQHGERLRSNNALANKPPTPIRAPSSATGGNSEGSTAMGFVASLFRGNIPPVAAAATITATERSSEDSKKAISKSKHSPIKSSGDISVARAKRLPPSGADENGCFIPAGDNNTLPPIYVRKGESNCDFDYKEVANNQELLKRLQSETLRFALEKNFYVDVKILDLKCCMNRTVINFTTSGMHHVGNDELIILLEYDPASPATAAKELKENAANASTAFIPKDIFIHLYEIYRDAELGNPIAELSYTSPRSANFLGKQDYGGFIFIRATFQCLQDVLVPEQPFLIGILIHRYEVPWAKVFPLRLMLRLGAQYRYYPCPHISIRNREPVYAEIAQTIINFLADFRNYTYTLPSIKGMYIHMEDRQTTVTIPRNRHEDVVKAIKNATDNILAFGGNFSKTADGHLVCMQNVNDMGTEMYAYSTQAINIQGQPRKVTGTSFFVLNESLKPTSGLSGKCSIVEDGLMVQILPSKMEEIRNALENQKDVEILCGPVVANDQQTEVVSIKWVDNDRDFNVGVKSPIDEKSMEGISSMRVHDSFNCTNENYAIRLTDIYIIKYDEWYASTQSALVATSSDITRIAGQIARSTCVALVPFLDLLVASGSRKLALRVTLHQENVCYEVGAVGKKLPSLYMDALDDQLIPILHGESSGIENAIILELVFYILNV